MRWTVEFADDARREFLALPEPIRHRVAKKISLLQENAFPPGCVKLKSYENLFRIKVGQHYRIVYFAHPSIRLVLITRVRHRKDAYRGL